MTMLSLFSGGGMFDLAAARVGIETVAMSEIEPFATAVTNKRFPQAKQLGDVTKIDGGAIEPCDLVTFGSPCTSWSIAGKQQSFDGQSGLFVEAIRVMREMLAASEGAFPRYFLFENVPNLLSINGGADWKIVMDSFADLGFICDANILDAQEFGVAQRRKRIFVVGVNRRYFDPAAFAAVPNCRNKRMKRALDSWGGACAACVNENERSSFSSSLGECFHGLVSRPHEPVRQKLSDILERDADPKYILSAKACLGILRRAESRGKVLPAVLSQALRAQAGLCAEGEPRALQGAAIFEPGAISRLKSLYFYEECAGTLRAAGGDNRPAVVYDARGNGDGDVANTLTGDHENRVTDYTSIVAYGISSYHSEAMKSANPTAGIYEAQTARTLDQQGGSPARNQGGVAICMTTGCYTQVCEEKAPCLQARDFKDPQILIQPHYLIRRLTERECLTLMGLPPDWCDGLAIESPTEDDFLFWEAVFFALGKKKSRKQIAKWLANPYTANAVYALAGNGVCVNVAEWVLQGLCEYDTKRRRIIPI
ncbi:MAG: DNA (cytosine-5-)-methyltransferase [Oscillospiraceae bacterium]|jgi:DNA (cytosine-5)-methyltransferase 1|nr:DNA (cytosine-5-)-methyltransferase [Oscillospiraceae bacterium]